MRSLLVSVGLAVASLLGQPSPATSASEPETFGFAKRVDWAGRNAVSLRRVTGYAVSSAIATASNSPREYGPHWDGFGRRVGLRMTTGATGLLMEASIGALWGEDPRYYRASEQALKARLLNLVKLTLLARNAKGELMPAYARYISVPTNSYVSNLWRPDSHATPERAAGRIPLAFVDRAIANTFSEFGPDLVRPFRKGRK